MKDKQLRRAMWEQEAVKVSAGRVCRDLGCKQTDGTYTRRQWTMILGELALTQGRTTKGKVYSMHALGTKCPSIALKKGSCISIQGCPGNLHDGHTLDGQREQMQALTGRTPRPVLVGKGCKGRGIGADCCGVERNPRKILCHRLLFAFLQVWLPSLLARLDPFPGAA